MTERGAFVVEVAWAEPGRQFLRRVELPSGATVGDAIRASGVERECGIDVTGLAAGIWSKPVARDALVSEGDRVEIYRPLLIDPKQARRLRAERAAEKKKR